jgi:hypothetical protein
VDAKQATPGDLVADIEARVLPEIRSEYKGVLHTLEGQQAEQRDTFGGLGGAVCMLVHRVLVSRGSMVAGSTAHYSRTRDTETERKPLSRYAWRLVRGALCGGAEGRRRPTFYEESPGSHDDWQVEVRRDRVTCGDRLSASGPAGIGAPEARRARR